MELDLNFYLQSYFLMNILNKIKNQKKIMLDLFEYGIIKYYQEIKRRAPKKNYILIRYITYFIHQPLNYFEI